MGLAKETLGELSAWAVYRIIAEDAALPIHLGSPGMEHLIVFTTTETAEDAHQLARELVERHLAACVQIVGPIRSVYRWEGKIESAEEFRCEIKTNAEQWDELERVLSSMHPYDVPEIVAVPLSQLSQPYANWMRDQLNEGA